MTDHAPDTHQSVPATGPLALKSNLVLGPNAHDVARESVDDALMIVESYGPWGADLNDAHRRQIVLADEVVRLRGLYEMAVRGRAEMRSALRQERRAEELHEGCQMPMEQARELAASEAGPDWYARGQDWGLADALTNGQSGDWVLDDIARAFAAGAASKTTMTVEISSDPEMLRRAMAAETEAALLRAALNGGNVIERLQFALQRLADAADTLGVNHFGDDWLSDEVQELQAATHAARLVLGPND